MNTTQHLTTEHLLQIALTLISMALPWIGLLTGCVFVLLADTAFMPFVQNRRLLRIAGVVLTGLSIGYLCTRLGGMGKEA